MTELTIYRLNRVPDKLHVVLLELLGIQLDPPSAASADLRFRLTGPGRRSRWRSRAARPRSGRRAPRATSRSSSRRSEDFTIEPLRPAAYVLNHDGKVGNVAVADGVAKPHGAEQLAFGNPPQARRRAAPRLRRADRPPADERRRRGVAGARRGRGPDRPAAALGGLGRRRRVASRPRCSQDLTGGFNYGSGAVELQLPPTQRACSCWAASACTGCAAASTSSPRPGASGASTPRRRRSTRSPPRRSARCCRRRTPRASSARMVGVSDGTPGQSFPLRMTPVLPFEDGETLEVQRARRRVVDGVGAARVLRGQPRGRPPLPARPRRGPDRARAGDPRDRLQLDAVRRGPAEGRPLRMSGYRHGGGRTGNVAAGTLTMLKSSLAGIDTVVNPRPAAGGVDAEIADRRAPARRDGHPLALPRGHRRRLRVPGRRGVAAGGPGALRGARRRRRGRRCTCCRAWIRPTGRLEADELDARRGAAAQRRRVPRRAPHDRHDASSCCRRKLRGVSVVVNLQATPTADPAASRRTSPTRSTRT